MMFQVEVGGDEHSLQQEIFVLGRDLNLHSRSLMEVVSKASHSPSSPPSTSTVTIQHQVPRPQRPSLAELGLLSESGTYSK